MSSGKRYLFTATALVLGVYFLILGLIEGSVFLAPLATAVILALLMIPVTRKMESWKINKTVAALFSTLLLFLIFIGFFALVSFQIKGFVDDWDKIQKTLAPKVEQLESYVLQNTSIEASELKEYKEESSMTSVLTSEGSGQKALLVAGSVVGFMGTFLLVIIYVFFLIRYRRRFKQFILKLFSDEKRRKIEGVISKTSSVAQDYLRGKLILISLLCVCYGIGLGISGVNNFILVSILAAFLTLIPFLGNIIGFMIAIAFGYVVDGEMSILIGIIITFTVAQFIESYVLEPYIVGDKVDLHPFFVILAVILGNLIWGIIGMALAVPILGILNVLFNNIKPLKPFGFLLSTEKNYGE